MTEDKTSPLENFIDTVKLIDVPIGSTLELECRFSIDDRKPNNKRGQRYTASATISIAKALIKQYIDSNCSIQQSINFISDKQTKQMVFINGLQQPNKHIHYTKRQLAEPLFVLSKDDMPEYKIALSFESLVDEFPISVCNFARARLRYVIILDEWRIDLTLVKNITSISNSIDVKTVKNKMLFPITPMDFIEKAPWEYADIIEFELEYIGEISKLSIDSFMTANSIFENAISQLHTVDSHIDVDYQSKIYQIAKWLKPRKAEDFKHRSGMKQLSNQVIELNKNTYFRDVYSTITSYYITDKIDGKRTILYVDNHKAYAVSNELVTLPYISAPAVYIIDCEFYEGKYYVFDVMVYDSSSLIDMPFSKRLEYFDKIISIMPQLKLKPFIKLDASYKTQIAKLKAAKPSYDTDGIILTPHDGTYNTMTVYKYKPIDKLSVDFLMKRCTKRLLGIKPYIEPDGYELYLLFCGIQFEAYQKLNMRVVKHYDDMFTLDSRKLPNYFPIQFEPSNDVFTYLYFHKVKGKPIVGSSDQPLELSDLNDQIGEFKLVHGKWQLMRIREDRQVEVKRGNYFGNNFRIAEEIWLSYDNALNIESDDDAGYFQVNDSSLHKEQRAFNNYVKSEIVSQFSDTAWALELGSGKGQDFSRYVKNRIGADGGVLFTDIDKTALMELISRKWEFANSRHTNGRIKVLMHQLDITANYKDNIVIIDRLPVPQTKFDIIVCNFAFHYFIKTHGSLMNTIRFIDYYLKPHGRFIFTAFDGEAVVKLLHKHKGTWNSDIKDKYSIKRAYTGDILLPIGQKIKLLLPFSAGEYYEEPLVNINYIEAEFAPYGYTLEINQSFSEFIPKYSDKDKLDADDITFVSLYSYYVLYKSKRTLHNK